MLIKKHANLVNSFALVSSLSFDIPVYLIFSGIILWYFATNKNNKNVPIVIHQAKKKCSAKNKRKMQKMNEKIKGANEYKKKS